MSSIARGASGGSGRTASGAAKAELIKSLESLGEIHQFQIIFYNEEPTILEIAGRGRLVFGNAQNKHLAERFIGSITADGADEPRIVAGPGAAVASRRDFLSDRCRRTGAEQRATQPHAAC